MMAGWEKGLPCLSLIYLRYERVLAMRVERYQNTRFWAVRDAEEMLVCVCVYKRGALEVMRRLQMLDQAQQVDTSHAKEDRSSKVISERC